MSTTTERLSFVLGEQSLVENRNNYVKGLENRCRAIISSADAIRGLLESTRPDHCYNGRQLLYSLEWGGDEQNGLLFPIGPRSFRLSGYFIGHSLYHVRGTNRPGDIPAITERDDLLPGGHVQDVDIKQAEQAYGALVGPLRDVGTATHLSELPIYYDL